MKIKSLDGKPLRDVNGGDYSAFEIKAIKAGVNGEYHVGDIFTVGSEIYGFEVKTREAGRISILRKKNGKLLSAAVSDDNYKGDYVPFEEIKSEPEISESEKKISSPELSDTAEKQDDKPTTDNTDNMDTSKEIQSTLANLATLIQKQAGNSATIDKDFIKRTIKEELDKEIQGIEEAHTTRVFVNKVEIKPLENEIMHTAFQKVVHFISNDTHVYLYGPAGTGKNVLAEQVAKALGLPFYCVSSLQNKYELEGFRDATGNYAETVFYKAMKFGGLFLFDEIDATSSEVLVAFNTMLANGYHLFPNGEKVVAHKDFHVIANGNTKGHGANETYCGRFPLDASTLNRFACIAVDYDSRIDLAAANGNMELAEFARSVRRAIKKNMLKGYVFTPRDIKRVVIAEGGGFPLEEVLLSAAFNSWDENAYSLASSSVSAEDTMAGNKYAKAFANLNITD